MLIFFRCHSFVTLQSGKKNSTISAINFYIYLRMLKTYGQKGKKYIYYKFVTCDAPKMKLNFVVSILKRIPSVFILWHIHESNISYRKIATTYWTYQQLNEWSWNRRLPTKVGNGMWKMLANIKQKHNATKRKESSNSEAKKNDWNVIRKETLYLLAKKNVYHVFCAGFI